MRKLRNKENGNTVLLTLLIVVVIGISVVVGIGIHNHNRKIASSTANNTTASSSSVNSTKTSTQTDIYAGWKTYCDSVYKYCFKYPTTWTIDANTASSLGGTVQTTLLNSSKTVEIDYINEFAHDSNPVSFTPVSLKKLSTANQDVTVVGGYEAVSGSYYSSYQLVDSKLLDTYPLSIGATAQFPNNPSFTDQNTGSNTYNGVFRAKSITTINSTGDAQAWFNSSDVKTSLLVLQSFYYNK